MKYRKEQTAACATKNPPGCRFQWCPDLLRVSIYLSIYPFGLAALFAPKSNKCHCVNYETATEDNWILIRFLLPLSHVVVAALCRLPLAFFSIYPSNSAFPITRDERERAHGSSQVTVFPMISNFWQDWITGFSVCVLAKKRSLLFNRS